MPKTAIVHSWLNQYGGAERVLEVLHHMYPEAPIYTSMYDPRAMPAFYGSWDIRTSFMQHLPLVKRHHQPFLPLYPRAFHGFDLSEYDVVLSVSSAFSHGVTTGPDACHICYCLTPPRFLWNFQQYVQRESINSLANTALPFVLSRLRAWDLKAAARVDYFVAISQEVANRIKRIYGREAPVIYPPVDTAQYRTSKDIGDFFLIVSRLIPYKRIDLAVEAFNRLGLPLVIAGDGRDRAALQAIAKRNIQFLGRVNDETVKDLYSRCRAFIFPGEEDFGLTPLEAQASGRPVIAYGAGGALETVVDGVTGLFFREPSAESLSDVVMRFRPGDFDPAEMLRNAARFDVKPFSAQFDAFVRATVARHRSRAAAMPASPHLERTGRDALGH